MVGAPRGTPETAVRVMRLQVEICVRCSFEKYWLSERGLGVKSWLIIHELNLEAHAEARLAAKLLKEEERFRRITYSF